jgi:hypothetical protein
VSFTTGGDHEDEDLPETDRGSDRIKSAFGVNHERLVVVKSKYDPMSLFRQNQSIKPTV